MLLHVHLHFSDTIVLNNSHTSDGHLLCVNFHSIDSFLLSLLFALFCRCAACVLILYYNIELFTFDASTSAICALCTSHLLPKASTCSLVILLVFLTTVYSLIISVIILLLSMPLMSVTLALSFSLYSHSLALILRQPIPLHSNFAFLLAYNTGVIEMYHCVEV